MPDAWLKVKDDCFEERRGKKSPKEIHQHLTLDEFRQLCATYGVADGLSNYNAFQLTVDKRMTKGLSMLVGYTWSHGIDNVATEFGGGAGTPQDIRCRNCDRSNSSFDMRHRLTLSYTYALPFFREATRDAVVACHGGISRCLLVALGATKPDEAINMFIPQDKIMVLRGTGLSWV